MIFSDEIKHIVSNYASNMPQAILLYGQPGTGLLSLAKHIAGQNGQLLDYVLPAQTSKTSLSSITVERIRQLYEVSRSKVSKPHFIIIDDAELMNHSAQNAFLKLLEEPNRNIHFILTSHNNERLLPTVRSRVQSFYVKPLSIKECTELLDELGVKDEAKRRQLLYIASGLPALLSRLIVDETLFKALSSNVSLCRQFIQGSTYERMVVIQAFKDDRQATLGFLDLTMQLLRRSLEQNASENVIRLIDRLLEAQTAIRANGNIRLQLIASVV